MGTDSNVNTGTDREKREIRRRMRRERSELDASLRRSYDLAITDNLLESDLLSYAACIYCFYSTDEEPDTTALLQALLTSGRKVACPRVKKGEIDFYYISALTDCCPGYRGICEPKKDCEMADDKEALVILPGLAFSREGGRIGYGGGYYDRFLMREPTHRTAALAYGFQVIESIPSCEYDEGTDYIVTPDGIIKCE